MGILESGGNILYLNVSCGTLVNKHKKISTYGYEGKFIKIERKEDEYEGKTIEKFKLHLADIKTDERTIISFSADSWYAVGFFQRIEKINLDRPFILGVSKSDKNEKISFCWMKQGEKKIEKDESFPAPKKVIVGKTEVVDWSEVSEKMDEITARINKVFPEAGKEEVERGIHDIPAEEPEMPEDDFPPSSPAEINDMPF